MIKMLFGTQGIQRMIVVSVVAILYVSSLAAQRQLLHLEGYVHDTEHRAVLFNSAYTCDSLRLKDIYGKSADPEQLVCFVNTYEKGQNPVLFEKDGVALCVDEKGELFSKDAYGEKDPYYLHVNIDRLLKGRRNVLVEADGSGYDSLIIRAVPVSMYALGRTNSKGAASISLHYDSFVYPARGELSPELLLRIYDGISILPEDGIAEDEMTLILPVELVNVPGSFSFYLYDLKGNILKMITDITRRESVIYRENLRSGTYRYIIYFNRNTEIKKGLLNFKEQPRPE
jgi:hypothetical protein